MMAVEKQHDSHAADGAPFSPTHSDKSSNQTAAMAYRPLVALTLGVGVSLTYRNVYPSYIYPPPLQIPHTISIIPSVTERSSPMHIHRTSAGAAERPWGRSHADTPTPAPAPAPASAEPHSVEELVPISSDFLRRHYSTFPDADISSELQQLRDEINALQSAIVAQIQPAFDAQSSHRAPAVVIDTILNEQIPSSMDSSMYSARCASEEAADRCAKMPLLSTFAPRFLAIASAYEAFQNKQKEHISDVIKEFLPNDFRGNVFSTFQHRSERNNSQAINDLMENGGTIREKYELLWQQQWKRRENLAMVGNATGVWRLLVKYLAGVPQPLLTFARDINAPNGPTEQIRIKYGAALAELVKFCIELNALCAAASFVDDAQALEQVSSQLERSLALYESEQRKFVTLLQDLIVNSPFFIRPDQIASLNAPQQK